ncbi:MAG: hypothetical protein CMH59_07005, partial [Myxococcales bacterium]|nr:hypothetical protein [Myxococcales bacterium]
MGEEASEETRARVGQVVGGRYRIEGVLGEGGFGAVYRATDAEGGRVVALKCLHAHLAGHKEILTRFRREALAADAIGHPNIVAVLDSGLEPPDPWIALELLEGRDAGQLLRDGGPLSVAHAVHIVGQVCDALDAAHAKGIVHRDLKLDNVFLVGEPGQERVKLLDFGVSKFLDAIDGASLMTRTGTTIGTPFYMSPEQAQGKKSVGPPADVYALGVILFKLLTGQHPFEDGSYPMLVLKICTEPPPPITRYRADVPPAFEAVVERMLAKAAEARYPSCAAVKAALAPFAEMDGPPRLTDAAPTSARRASALGGSVMESAPTALSVDPHTGEPLLPDLEEEAAKTERAMSSGGGKWIGIGVLVLALVGAGVWWATQVGPESGGGGEVEAPSLPTPQPPRIAPLQVPEGAELGWRWVNPLPRAMPTWNDVAVGGPGLVAMVGREGRGGRMVGGSLSSWGTGTEADLHALAWIGPAQVIAVGDDGAVQLMLQSGPRALETGVESDLRDVAALGTTDAIAVGDEGTILRLPGLQPTPLPSGHSEHLYGVHVEGEDTFAVGQRGLVLRVRGEEIVTERRPTGPSLRAVGGCGGAIYAVGDDGIVLRRASEGRWGRLDDTGDGDWTDVACDGGRVVASGSEGDVLVLAGDRSVRLSSGGERGLRGIGAAEGERTWVVGDGGLLATLEESRLRLLTAGHTGTLFDAGTLGGVLVAVGRWGAILREEDDRLKPAASPTDAALAALTLLSEDRLVAVGD